MSRLKNIRFYRRRVGRAERAEAVPPEQRSVRQQNDVHYGRMALAMLRELGADPHRRKP